MYINNLIRYEQKEDLKLNNEGCEDLWIKLLDSRLNSIGDL